MEEKDGSINSNWEVLHNIQMRERETEIDRDRDIKREIKRENERER